MRTSSSKRTGGSPSSTRHTTHLEELPESVAITRPSHPLVGTTLPVLTQAVRNEELTLLLLFPNGDRHFVPVAWTDAVPPECLDPPPRRDECLAPLAALLRARAIVDALLQRLSAAQEAPDANLSPAAPAATDTAVPEHAHPGRGDLGDA